MFYVYAYFEPGGKVPFYIGKGVRHRSRVHLSRSHNSAVARKIAALRGNGFEPEVRLLYFGTDEQCKLEEIRLIRLRSEEHTSELQSRQYLVCRLLLEKK